MWPSMHVEKAKETPQEEGIREVKLTISPDTDDRGRPKTWKNIFYDWSHMYLV